MNSLLFEPSILFIDDESDTLDRLGYIFNNNFRCYFASSGESGISAFKLLKPAMVICDVNLPDISGYDICLKLKASNPELCLVLLSAYNDQESRLEGLEAFADSYLDKSLDDKELFLRIRNLHPSSVILQVENEPSEDIVMQINTAFEKLYTNRKTTHSVTIESISQLLSMSKRTLQRRIKDETSLSFTQHQLKFRLNKAQELLKQGYNASTISEVLKFSSPSHFSCCFKKHFDMTPSAYLHACKSNNTL